MRCHWAPTSVPGPAKTSVTNADKTQSPQITNVFPTAKYANSPMKQRARNARRSYDQTHHLTELDKHSRRRKPEGMAVVPTVKTSPSLTNHLLAPAAHCTTSTAEASLGLFCDRTPGLAQDSAHSPPNASAMLMQHA